MSHEHISDFITDGGMAVRGEHLYIRLSNPFIGRSYLFHLPMKLFCMIVKNRVIEQDEYVWKTKEEIEDIKNQKQNDQLKYEKKK